LKITTKDDVLQNVEHFLTKENKLDELCGVCTDGAPDMLASKSSFGTLVHKKRMMLSRLTV